MSVITANTCFHCGDAVGNSVYETDGHAFCCLGCQSVYQILNRSQMQQYYRYDRHPGKKQPASAERYDYLDEPAIAGQLVDYQDDKLTIFTCYIPVIHCSACVWLLENLYRLQPAVVSSRCDFMKKQVTVTFKQGELSLRGLVELLANIGYAPKITLQDVLKEGQRFSQAGLIAKIAVAGFCFGNSMMLSFPEYFGMAAFEAQYATFFRYMNLAFSLPVLLYSGQDYFRSAWQSLRQYRLNLDVPLALGILVLFVRTAWEVVSGTGAGFGDTLCGLVFFLLVGRWVQQRTYHHLSFERDYRSYFPVAVTRLEGEGSRSIPIAEIQVGDRLLIRNNEIVPADAILWRGAAAIDFSFVTGESEPVQKVQGDIIYAGGRQIGAAIEVEVVKAVSQSHLTRLWNNEGAKPYERQFQTFSNTVSQYFTPALLAIGVAAMAFWFVQGDPGRAWAALTAVLIIACPCALALSSPFTLSTALSIFDRNRFYLKNTAAVEQLATIDSLVFDKTGTLSSPSASRMQFQGDLPDSDRIRVAAACASSNHPMSREIVRWAGVSSPPAVTDYHEIPGKGIDAVVIGSRVRVGNAAFIGVRGETAAGGQGSQAYLEIDGQVRGCISMEQPWRPGLAAIIEALADDYRLDLVSGDNAREERTLRSLFPKRADLRFNQLPEDKRVYIQSLQQRGRKVCMLGDGLNDAGALRQADFGIAVSDDINSFSPGCDAILDGGSFERLPRFLRFAKDVVRVIHKSFGISVCYNLVGLSFAVAGTMSPLFAAILMPLSTITIIVFTTVATRACAAKHHLLQPRP